MSSALSMNENVLARTQLSRLSLHFISDVFCAHSNRNIHSHTPLTMASLQRSTRPYIENHNQLLSWLSGLFKNCIVKDNFLYCILFTLRVTSCFDRFIFQLYKRQKSCKSTVYIISAVKISSSLIEIVQLIIAVLWFVHVRMTFLMSKSVSCCY